MQFRTIAIVVLMAFLAACGERTGNAALDEALWNGWPGDSVGHVDNSAKSFEVAALVHRGGMIPDQDAAAIRATVDRVLRYAARQAQQRQAAQFEIRASLNSMSRGVYRGSQRLATTRHLWLQAFVALTDEGESPAKGSAVFRTSEVLAAPKEQLLSLPPTAVR
ncbi:MAG: hypothetical protein KF889_02010 [Alphaproteobacteria bacterium]|nr:hypothetical protein [Alphaproteobacteria bacterium]MCW5741683.1 hypothetical protein [Alphaproteobacteria bacterium]